MIPQWLILWTHGKIQQSHTWTRAVNSNLNSKKVGCFAEFEKTVLTPIWIRLDPLLITCLAAHHILHISAVIPHFGYKYENVIPHRTPKTWFIPKKHGKTSSPSSASRRVARNSQWGGLFGGSGGFAPSRRRPMGVWGRSPQLPEAGGLGAKPPAAGGTGVWGQSPQCSKILHFFAKITSF